MSHVLAIAARELRERNRIFVAAAAFAVVPFLIALLPGAKSAGRPMMIALTGGLLAVAVALGTAVALGASIVGRELTEKRLSFFFARPISAAAIWWGKAIAAIVTSLTAFAIILLPSLMVGLDVWKTTWTVQPQRLIPFTMICAIVLFFVAHAASTMIRSRSALLAIDVLLLGTTLFALYLISQPLIVGMAGQLLAWVGLAFAVAIFLVLAVVPVWQLDRGRTDRVRSHAALSLYLWSSVGVIVLLTGAFVLWVASASPADLEPGTIAIEQSPDGRAVMLAGKARNRVDYHAVFLIDGDGRATRISAEPWWPVEFSRDGRTVVWRSLVNPLKRRGEAELILRQRSDAPEATGIRVGRRGFFVLSHDGSRLAVFEGSNISVHDVKAKRLLFSSNAATKDRAALFFRTTDILRVVERQSSNRADGIRLIDVDVRTRTVTTVGEFKAETKSVGFSPNGRLMLIRGAGHIVDTHTGKVLRTLRTPTAYFRWAVVLDDGTAVARRRDGDELMLDISTSDGQTKVVPVGNDAKSYVAIEGEIAPSKLLISIGRGWNDLPHRIRRAVAVLDVKQGVITNRVENASVGGSWSSDPRLTRIDATNLAAFDGEGKAVRVNMLTGERRTLVRE